MSVHQMAVERVKGIIPEGWDANYTLGLRAIVATSPTGEMRICDADAIEQTPFEDWDECGYG